MTAAARPGSHKLARSPQHAALPPASPLPHAGQGTACTALPHQSWGSWCRWPTWHAAAPALVPRPLAAPSRWCSAPGRCHGSPEAQRRSRCPCPPARGVDATACDQSILGAAGAAPRTARAHAAVVGAVWFVTHRRHHVAPAALGAGPVSVRASGGCSNARNGRGRGSCTSTMVQCSRRARECAAGA